MRTNGWKVLCVLIILHLLGLEGCKKCDEQTYYSVIDLFVKNTRIINATNFEHEEISENEQVPYDKICIQLSNSLEYITQSFNPPTFNFYTTALGCDHPDPLPAERITNISLTSNADLVLINEDIVFAGNSLNPRFLIYHSENEFIPLPEFLDSSFSHPNEAPLYLFLNAIPAYNQSHRFSVYYELDNGKTFQASTGYVIITP